MQVSDEAVAKVALALADEVRTWPDDSALPYNSAVGVGRTFQVLARAALAAAPCLEPDRDALERALLAVSLIDKPPAQIGKELADAALTVFAGEQERVQ